MKNEAIIALKNYLDRNKEVFDNRDSYFRELEENCNYTHDGNDLVMEIPDVNFEEEE